MRRRQPHSYLTWQFFRARAHVRLMWPGLGFICDRQINPTKEDDIWVDLMGILSD
jgi:hypothetical protein